MSDHVHDFVGIGAGPFNLGLAALTDPLPDLDGVVLEARDDVAWHPGMLLDEVTLQVPFLGDLVTMADPTSRWSYLNYLKQTGALYPFYVREDFHPLRREYSDYLQWAADGLASVRLGQQVVRVEHDGACYVATTAAGDVFRGDRLVLGIGTTPRMPACLEGAGGPALHTSAYREHRDGLRRLRSVTVVGSGQSSAEVYRDLLAAGPDHDYDLTWLTRSPRFFAMDDTKLTLEMTSPDYTAYFQGLDADTRARLLREQRVLYQGISAEVVDAISDLHYQLRVSGDGPRTTLVTATELREAAWDGSAYELGLWHTETGEAFGLRTEGLVVGTGYAAPSDSGLPGFLEPIRERLRLDADDRFVAGPTYATDHEDREVFVLNAEEHSHGFVAPDLGMGAHRNSVVIAAMTGREVYPVEKRVAVQSFGVPDHLRRSPR